MKSDIEKLEHCVEWLELTEDTRRINPIMGPICRIVIEQQKEIEDLKRRGGKWKFINR